MQHLHSSTGEGDVENEATTAKIPTTCIHSFNFAESIDQLLKRGDVRFGSLAVIQTHISLMSAIGRIADTRQRDFESPWLNVRFHPKRSFR